MKGGASSGSGAKEMELEAKNLRYTSRHGTKYCRSQADEGGGEAAHGGCAIAAVDVTDFICVGCTGSGGGGERIADGGGDGDVGLSGICDSTGGECGDAGVVVDGAVCEAGVFRGIAVAEGISAGGGDCDGVGGVWVGDAGVGDVSCVESAGRVGDFGGGGRGGRVGGDAEIVCGVWLEEDACEGGAK